MLHSNLRMIAVALCLVGVSCSDAAPKDPASDSKVIEGLWFGSWGGGGGDGVVFQPVLAELFIKGDHVEFCGFRSADRLTGTVRLDASTRRLHITSTAVDGGQPTLKLLTYAYEIKGDELTLIDSDKIPISLQRVRTAQDPLGDAEVQLVEATGINDAGDLLVTEFTVLRAGRSGAGYFKPENRSLKTKQATVGLVQESGWKKVTIDEARKLLRKPTPVVVTYGDKNRPALRQFHKLWKDTGSPPADSDAVWRTFSQILRPGTLVFVLSARENVPQP